MPDMTAKAPSRSLRVVFVAPALLGCCLSAWTEASEVRIAGQPGRFQLLRNGQPYFIRGAGADERRLKSVAAAGGNSIRLWGDEKLGETLDAAHALGLTVCAGFWVGQVRQGFDWGNADALAQQRERLRATVTRYKGHPALLLWAIGNEMEDTRGRNVAVWTAINDLATMVKQIDPHHPTMTVIAEIGGEKVKNIHRLCPAVDIVGINSYGGAPTLGARYAGLGGTKPYLLTEFGPPGIWEVEKNALGAFPEPTSTEKAGIYRRAYQGAVLGQPGVCLGSYVFYWGQKQEVTSTWFSMLLRDGSRLAPVDAMTELWTGIPPANRAPEIARLEISGLGSGNAGDMIVAKLTASDPENDPLKVDWLLQRDPEKLGTGGDREEEPPVFAEAIVRGDLRGAQVRLPTEAGLYRLFVAVRDNHGGAATANVTVRVSGPTGSSRAHPAALPLAVYSESAEASGYVPSGWMGDTKAIELDPAWVDRPQSGKTCLRCAFNANKGWGGVAWQNPPNDWGERAGGYDLTRARKLTFFARGEQGGEEVNFEFGIIPPHRNFPDTGRGRLEKLVLGKDWQRYEIPITGQDLTRIKTGFAWTVRSRGKPVIFYLDNILWE
jgi:Glycosyl hydrolases family 2, TIM barrel domain